MSQGSILTCFSCLSQWDSVGATRPASTGDRKYLQPIWPNLLESCSPLAERPRQCDKPGRQVSNCTYCKSDQSAGRQADVRLPLWLRWISSRLRLPIIERVLSCLSPLESCQTGWRWSSVVARGQSRVRSSLMVHWRPSVWQTHSRKKNIAESTSASRWDQTAACMYDCSLMHRKEKQICKINIACVWHLSTLVFSFQTKDTQQVLECFREMNNVN